MNVFFAFLRLTRFPNLFFILLTQGLFYYCVFMPLLHTKDWQSAPSSFWLGLLIAASVFIAAGGYIINDYFDMRIDQVNKPSRMVVDKLIKRRWVIVWHWLFSLIGILLSWLVSRHTGTWLILIVNIICVIMLWFYSTRFKSRLLSGNVIISLLTAWVILVVFFFAGGNLFDYYVWFSSQTLFDARKFFKLTMLYAGFSFIVSLVREVVKDIEDMQGDRQFDCRTMPIVWGVPVSKMFAAVWLVVGIIAMLVIQFYAFHSARIFSALYCLLFIVVPMGYCLKKLYTAAVAQDYHRISNYLKLIMLAGILSMLFFKFNV